jgi:hypothetical protein
MYENVGREHSFLKKPAPHEELNEVLRKAWRGDVPAALARLGGSPRRQRACTVALDVKAFDLPKAPKGMAAAPPSRR